MQQDHKHCHHCGATLPRYCGTCGAPVQYRTVADWGADGELPPEAIAGGWCPHCDDHRTLHELDDAPQRDYRYVQEHWYWDVTGTRPAPGWVRDVAGNYNRREA